MGLAPQLVKRLFPLSTHAYNLRPMGTCVIRNLIFPFFRRILKKCKSWIPENCSCRLCKTYLHQIDFIQKYLLNISFSTIAHDFIANRLYYYGNDKDDNVSFYYSGGFLILLLLLSLLIMVEILSDFLQAGNIFNLYYFYTIDFLKFVYFCPIFALKVITIL